jgi:hypothetical protein
MLYQEKSGNPEQDSFEQRRQHKLSFSSMNSLIGKNWLKNLISNSYFFRGQNEQEKMLKNLTALQSASKVHQNFYSLG